MHAASAHTTHDADTGRTELHTDDVSTFADLGLDLPFEYGDAIYDSKRGTVRIPRAIAPSENGGFRVYCFTHEVRERSYTNELQITDAGGPGANSTPMKLLLTILEEDTCEIISKDRIKA